MSSRRAALRIVSDDTVAFSTALRERRAQGVDCIVLACDEAALLAHVADAVSAAATAGFTRVGLVVPCTFAIADHADALRAAGLHDVIVPIHAAQPDAHDYVAGLTGSFAIVSADVAACHARRLRVFAQTQMCRANYRLLDDLALHLVRSGVAGWCIDVPSSSAPDGREQDAAGFERSHPRLALAVPFALRAVDRARGGGVRAWVRGVPLCLLGPMTGRALPAEPRAFPTACAPCAAKPACAGVDAAYLRRFTGDELRARSDAPTVDTADALSRAFTENTPGAPP